jgi:hypothetical protein
MPPDKGIRADDGVIRLDKNTHAGTNAAKKIPT